MSARTSFRRMIGPVGVVISFAILAGMVFFYDRRDLPKVASGKPVAGPPPAAVAPVIAPPASVRPEP